MASMNDDKALAKVPEGERQHWIVPATIFGGLEFSVPVIMIGAALAGSFGLSKVLLILIIGLVVIQWIGNALQGYLGAKTGLPSAVISRTSFGSLQARFLIGLALVILNIGWFAVNTAVAGNAISAVLGVDYKEQWMLWALLTAVAGILFSLPAIIGYNSMKWTDYLAVPAGLLLIFAGVFYSLKGAGWEKIASWNPEPSMTFLGGVSLILGANVAQWLIASDYTRYSKPKIKDQALIPLGIIVIGFVFFLTGAIMSVGVGSADIVAVMQDLGFPFWGFLILWLALWTSQIVASYSTGLAAANMFNIDSGKGRAWLTIGGSIAGIILALAGILNFFMDFLILLGVIYPAIAGVMFADFFFIRNKQWVDKSGWNWVATLALLIGALVGYLTQYEFPLGIPAVQSLVISGIVYLSVMKLKARVKPDQFTKVDDVINENTNEAVNN
ncbi:cytosine permease [Bacillus sp. DTU_2020_1000418_1_SI_GHA_SEK_038]|uniref:purine-cytosine permease family protein n=1 Tax=Bacillus sp. DTU_2020_1000418_1_SI_GHA_SEK_038 TaxID=3077585 RepID=UPI0028E3025C|nr:cytosine permease [Bacillus sp. DTU_2020_1000418_1_SI_GHA_SEK_038]WNS74738.1 cytosine permease [Bacillus sp. DTU_2020_1000418_1_SI_GHA_SEK_038]